MDKARQLEIIKKKISKMSEKQRLAFIKKKIAKKNAKDRDSKSKLEKDRPSIMEDKDTVVTEKDAKLLSKIYYEDGMVFGRDGIYHHLKTLYPDTIVTKDGVPAGVKTNPERPSRRVVMKWLSKQKLHQEFSGTKSGGTTNYFVPVKPFKSMSIDLIDFNFKPSGTLRYIIVLVDNFSRQMLTTPITGKTAEKTAKGMENLFKQIKEKHGQEAFDKIKYINSDDGPEFKGDFDKLLKAQTNEGRKNGIQRRRTLGGSPAQNGLVEKMNHRLKRIMAKLIKINGGSWSKHLQNATRINNKQIIRTTGYTPDDALKLKPNEYEKLIDNVKANHDDDIIVRKDIYKAGDKVRLKLNKGTLGKSSTPSWSDKVYTVGDVIKSKNPQIADKYKVVGRAQDQLYSRNDLQKIIEVEEIPRKKKLTQKEKEEIADYLRLDEDSIVDGAFSDAVLKERKARFDLEFPDGFKKGNEKMTKQLLRLDEESKQGNKGEKVVRAKRTRKQTKVLDPSLNPSDSQLRGKKKMEEYEVEKLVDTRIEDGDKEYLVKWVGYNSNENTWEKEFREKKGKKKRERNIPKKFVDMFQRNKDEPQANTEKKSDKTLKKKQREVEVKTRKKGNKLFE